VSNARIDGVVSQKESAGKVLFHRKRTLKVMLKEILE